MKLSLALIGAGILVALVGQFLLHDEKHTAPQPCIVTMEGRRIEC